MQELNLPLIAVFLLSVAVLVGTGLGVIIVVLRAQRRYRRRLARVSRARQAGLDMDDARLSLLRDKPDASAFDAISHALARVFPLMDITRLRANISRAGMSLSVGAFVMISLILCVVIATLAAVVSGYPLPVLLPPAAFAGMFLVDSGVKLRGDMMAARFMTQLPEAIDSVIRGIRSGLPVTECVALVGQEFTKPIGPYFQSVGERVRLGEPLDASLWRVARVINRPEMDFFAISIAIQMETGGSLAEALGNLADLLRQRQRLKLKIKAISSEAKASAIIIGLLPFAIMALLMVMSPEYVMPLFTDPRGRLMLGAGLSSIGLGALVMWRMTQFEI